MADVVVAPGRRGLVPLMAAAAWLFFFFFLTKYLY